WCGSSPGLINTWVWPSAHSVTWPATDPTWVVVATTVAVAFAAASSSPDPELQADSANPNTDSIAATVRVRLGGVCIEIPLRKAGMRQRRVFDVHHHTLMQIIRISNNRAGLGVYRADSPPALPIC